jgi:hypothetical protein
LIYVNESCMFSENLSGVVNRLKNLEVGGSIPRRVIKFIIAC